MVPVAHRWLGKLDLAGILDIMLPRPRQCTILDESQGSIAHGCRQPSHQAHKTICRRRGLAFDGSAGRCASDEPQGLEPRYSSLTCEGRPFGCLRCAPLERNVPPGFTSWAIAAPPLCENRCQYGPDNLCWRQSVLSTLLEQRLDRVPSSLNHSLRDGLFSDKMGDYSTHLRDLLQFGSSAWRCNGSVIRGFLTMWFEGFNIAWALRADFRRACHTALPQLDEGQVDK